MKITKWIYISVPLILILSALGANVYDWLEQPEMLAPFTAINKSVWEYLKTLIFPVLVFWMTAYFARYKLKISRVDVLASAALSVVVSPGMTALMYYFYICAFGIHSKAIDFLLAVVSVMTGQFASHHLCTYMYTSKRQGRVAFLVIIMVLSAFIICTYYTPKLPIFMDPETGTYGIRRIMD